MSCDDKYKADLKPSHAVAFMKSKVEKSGKFGAGHVNTMLTVCLFNKQNEMGAFYLGNLYWLA